ncbi:MAG: hypothetical protein J5864_08420 [Oscillospiraceae bacterium]|nr:hypothetical protein [Oscillospiraceae bacterium]
MNRKSLYLSILIIIIMLSSACGKSSGSPASLPSNSPSMVPDLTPVPTETPEPEPLSVELTGSDGSHTTLYEYDTDVTITDSAYIAGLIENASILTEIRSIALADGIEFSFENVEELNSCFPLATISYNVVINGKQIPLDATSLDLSSLPPDSIGEAARELKKLPVLQQINLTPTVSVTTEASKIEESKKGSVFNDNLSVDQVLTLVDSRPDLTFDYKFLLYGKTVSTADERLEYTDVKIYDDGVESVIRPIMPAMNRLKYLKLDKCEVTSPVMAKLRDDFPNVKVVWRVYFSSYGQTADGSYAVYNCLTDTEKVWATGCVTDNFASELQYCTDVRYLDLGHNCITDISFTQYMPNLEMAVFSVSWVESLAPLAKCENLVYLECFSSRVTDISPLASCKKLQYLNISNLAEVKDISPLYDLDLKRFYCTMSYIPAKQQEEFQSLHPDCDCEFGWVDPSKSKWRFIDGNYLNTNPSNRNEMYAKLYEVFGYDNPSKNQSK